MQSWLALLGAAAPSARLTAWDAIELAALALLAASTLLLWRRARKPASPPVAEGLPLVIAAAAVAAVIDEPHRIVGVVEVQAPARTANLWSLEGRRSLFASHQLR